MTTTRAGDEMGDWGQDGWAVGPGQGRRVDLQGPHELELLVRGAQVGDALGAFVFTHAVIEENPPHAHTGFMKIIHILDGEYELRVGDAVFSGGPGTTVVVPRGSQHTFTTATGGRMLFVCSPSGNEELFVRMSELGPGATPEQLAELNREFGTVGPVGHESAAWSALHQPE